jgi:hypothetical protein
MTIVVEAGSVERTLLKLLKESLPRAARSQHLAPDTKLRSIGIDSLALTLLIARFAEAMGIDLAEMGEARGQPETVGDLLATGQAALDEWHLLQRERGS